MARQRDHLARAPIVEAVIDFRVLRQDQVSSKTFEGLGPSIGEQYSQKSEMQSIEGRFGFENGKPVNPSSVQATVGWLYRTKTELAQFRMDGFTFSKVEQYTTWNQVFGEANRLWKIYVDAAKPKRLSRVAVRYINRMRLTASTDLRQYLEAPPYLPEPIPQVVREFLSRIVVEDATRGASAVIVQALEPRLDPSSVSVVLDIDASRNVDSKPDDPDLPGIFEQLRRLKNDIFFASITEKTAEMYE
jgi:uncharacterized protein (TIGR04255 family)